MTPKTLFRFRFWLASTLLTLVFFSAAPSSYANEKCGNLLLLPTESTSSVTLRLSLSSCEKLANAAEVSFLVPPHLSFKNEDLLLENLYKLPNEEYGGIITLRFVSLSDMQGVNDLADLHFEKVSPGDSLPHILPSSLVLLSDGKGTNIFSIR